MRSRKFRETVEVPHTRDGITVMVEETREHLVPALPRDWDVIAVRVATGLVLALTAVSVAWSTWSIGSLLRGGIGYAAATIFDIAWAVCLILEWLARFDATKRAFPRRLGWVLLVVTMAFIGWHGLDVGQPGMAVVGAAVSLFAKTLWLGVMKHIDRELSSADQAWVEAQVSDAHARMAVAVVRRQVARLEDRAAREMLAMEAARAQYRTVPGRSAEATVEVLSQDLPGVTAGTGSPALEVSRPVLGTKDETTDGTTDGAAVAVVPLVREGASGGADRSVDDGSSVEVPQDLDTVVPQVNTASAGGVAGSAGTRHLHPVRGSATQEIKALVSSGVTDVGTIRDHLSEAGLKVPDPSYIRRLIRTSRPAEAPPGQYL